MQRDHAVVPNRDYGFAVHRVGQRVCRYRYTQNMLILPSRCSIAGKVNRLIRSQSDGSGAPAGQPRFADIDHSILEQGVRREA